MSESNAIQLDRTVDSIRDWLIDRAAVYLQQPKHSIDPDVPLLEMGLESVHAMALVGDVGQHFDLVVEPAAAWAYPTINLLAEFVDEELHDR